jgi:hypothetical protein
MSEGQLEKIISDLSSPEEKLKILALMYVSRLSERGNHEPEALNQLIDQVILHGNSPSPDLAFLAKKALNHLRKEFSSVLEKSDNSASANLDLALPKQTRIERQMSSLPEDYQDFRRVLPLLKRNDPRVIALAIETMSRLAPPDRLQAVISEFLAHENNRVRGNAVVALGRLSESLIQETLQTMIESPKLSMRESAVWAVGQLPPSSFLKDLLLERLKDPYRDIRLRAIQSLETYPEKAVVNELQKLNQDPDAEVRERAAQLAEVLSPLCVAPLDGNIQSKPEKLAIREEDYDQFIEEHELNESENKPVLAEVTPFEQFKQQETVDSPLDSTDSSFDLFAPPQEQPMPQPEVQKPIRTTAVLRKEMSDLLRHVGLQSYELCQDYEPDNAKVASEYKTILNLRQELDPLNKKQETLSEQEQQLSEQLRQKAKAALIQLGRITLEEIKRNTFSLHNSENYQKQFQKLRKEFKDLQAKN